MALKDRVIFRSVFMEYKGQPKISFSVDGVEKLSESTLPNHTVRQTRRVSLPAGCTGYNGQLFINPDFKGKVDYAVEKGSVEAYREKTLFHYFNVHFTGNITLQMFIDEVALKPNNGASASLSLSPRKNKTTDTRKIYVPPLAYGFEPHIQQTIKTTESGQIISSEPIALNPAFNKGLRLHSEFQATYQGECNLEIFLDGESILREWLPEQKIPQDGGYSTHKDYLPTDTNGHILQWMQLDGDGDIALFETDMTLADKEQPNIAGPQ